MYLLLALLCGYIIGNFSPSYLLVKILKHDDIRDYGSGNAGATNAIRVLGFKSGLVVFILDMLKGAGAVLAGKVIAGDLGLVLGALGVVLGHNFPVLLGFRGGKGVAASGGIILAISPKAFLIIAVVFLLILATTRIVSLASILIGILIPFTLYYFQLPSQVVILGIILCALILLRHHSNIGRLIKGNERKINLKLSAKPEGN